MAKETVACLGLHGSGFLMPSKSLMNSAVRYLYLKAGSDLELIESRVLPLTSNAMT